MSLATHPGVRRDAPAPMGLLAPLGIALGLLCFATQAAAGWPARLYAAAPGAWPTPEQITAYATAICGAIVTAANTGYFVWHRLQAPPRRRRKKKDGTGQPPDAAPAAP